MLTCEQIYHKLYKKQERYMNALNEDKHLSEDFIRRQSNIYAVKNTVQVWREQYKRKSHHLYETEKRK